MDDDQVTGDPSSEESTRLETANDADKMDVTEEGDAKKFSEAYKPGSAVEELEEKAHPLSSAGPDTNLGNDAAAAPDSDVQEPEVENVSPEETNPVEAETQVADANPEINKEKNSENDAAEQPESASAEKETGEDTGDVSQAAPEIPAAQESEGGASGEEEPVDNAMDIKEEGEVATNESEAAPKEEENVVEKAKAELPYSIRGRHPPRDGSEFDQSSRGYRDNTSETGALDAASDLGPVSRTGDAPGTSFLETLTDEERRLRTRYVPDVEGIRTLHKSEVKRDLSLARSVMSSAGVAGTLSSKKRSKKAQSRSSDEDRMDIDEEEGAGHSEDDRASDVSSRHGSSSADLETRDLSIVSAAFVAPPENSVASSNGDSSDVRESQSSVPASKRWQAPAKSPLVVESISAYNPPRPSESSGPKKKHRMLRWERNPQAPENELRALRQTVQNIRGELHRAEHERERLETVNSVLRTHFLSHLNIMKDESVQLTEELASIQVDCVKAADLLTSRTRSRGVGKGVYVMRDVLSVLKTRGASLNEKSITPRPMEVGSSLPGVGGVSSVSFLDWDCKTNITPNTLAAAWILPGDKVQTPYGDGVALHVLGPSNLDVNDSSVEYSRPKPAASPKAKDASPQSSKPQSVEANGARTHGFGGTEESSTLAAEPSQEQIQGSTNGNSAPAEVKSAPNVDENKENEKKENGGDKNDATADQAESPEEEPSSTPSNGDSLVEHVLLPRVCVRLPFGVGFFPLDCVTSKEDATSYSDAMLSARWDKMVKVALSVGCCIDVAGMEKQFTKEEGSVRTSIDNDSVDTDVGSKVSENERMEVDSGSGLTPPNVPDESDRERGMDKKSTAVILSSELMGENKTASSRFVPVGSTMLSTASGRGALLPTAPIDRLEKGVNTAFYEFSEVLGRPSNPGVPEGVKNWEAQRYETCLLRAKVLQLRNELYRQRRIRTLNERTFVTSRDRSHRVEHLLTEMRSDLKSLKRRLEDELYELGIDEEKALNLLSTYYKDKDSSELATIDATPPPKRKRKLPKEQPPVEPKHTRRRAADAAEERVLFDQEGASGENEEYGESEDKLPGMSGDDMGMDQSSDDDADSRRAHKRSRVAA